MTGGTGDDIYYVNVSNDIVTENANEGVDDWVISIANFTLPANVEGLRMQGSASSGNGNNLANIIEGTDNANIINGNDGADTIASWGGNDIIQGGNGNDHLAGGAGMDTLSGNSGSDVFRYSNVSDSPVGTSRDKITDFNRGEGDKIHLIDIDADLTLAGNQKFTVGSYVSGILTADVIGGPDLQIELVGAPALDLNIDIML